MLIFELRGITAVFCGTLLLLLLGRSGAPLTSLLLLGGRYREVTREVGGAPDLLPAGIILLNNNVLYLRILGK